MSGDVATTEDRSGPGEPVAPLLEAISVSKHYEGIAALSDVSLRIDPGDVVGLLGPNGAGKTTLFDCLTGRQRPTSGTVRFDGSDVSKASVHDRARRGIARTFQRMELFSGLTVRQHLAVAHRARYGGRGIVRDALAGFRPDAAERARCDEILDLLGLGADAERPIDALSLGRGRLVELGRALITDPKILFLDEPSSGLDRQETHDMGTVLLDLQRATGLTVLIVEHDIPMVQRMAQRLYVLDAGALIAHGDADTVLADPVVRQAYLGSGA